MLQITQWTLDYGRVTPATRSHYTGEEHPVFGWAVRSDRDGGRQSACHAVVYRENDILWDSGWVETAEQSIAYAGPALPEGVELGIALEIRDEAGEESAPYEDFFYNARVDWKAPWIGDSDPVQERPTYFRRDFTVTKGLKDACLYVCGIGYQHVYLDGEDDLLDLEKLDPAFTDYIRQCQYVMYPDLADALKPGRHCLAAIVASGWRDNPGVNRLLNVNDGNVAEFMGQPCLTAMLRLTYQDGREELIVTDETWQCGHGGYQFASVFDGTVYDAREDAPEWNLPDFKGNFRPVKLMDPLAATHDCRGWYFKDPIVYYDAPVPTRMEPMLIPPIIEFESTAPMAVWSDGDAVMMDFGQNLAGVVDVILPDELAPGQKLHLTFSEELTEDGKLFRDTLRGAKAEDFYIASGDDRDLVDWQSDFTYHGFRYARLEGLGAGFDAAEFVTAVQMHTDLDTRSTFRCGSALLTQIHKNSVETERGNMHSILTDCPQRDERQGWMNDATVRFEATPYNFDIGRMFPKIVRDLMDMQTAEGAIGCTAPFIFGGIPADPVCSSFLVAGYESMMHKGNRKVIADAFAAYEAWEACLLKNSTDHIVNYSYYGDWAGPLYACVNPENGAPGTVSAVTPGEFMSTGYSYYNCVLLSRFAGWLNLPEKKQYYLDLAQTIREAMLKKWYDPETCRMATGSQACQAFSLWLGILPPADCQKAAQAMRDDLVNRNYDFTTGNLCTRYLLDMLAKYGYENEALALLEKETCPSYGFMIQQEATTIWERFELMTDATMNSHNHPMYGAVDYWFYACLAGVRPLTPGWTEFEVAPVMPEKLQFAQAVVDTCKGEVNVRWVRRYGGIHLQVTVPFGCTALVRFGGRERRISAGFHTFHA